MAKILVTGGTGYIGSHTIVDLLNQGFDVISLDNYINSTAATLTQIRAITGQEIINYEIDLCDLDALGKVFEQEPITAIIHFAALKSVEESVRLPLLYHRNNVSGILNLLHCIRRYEVPHLIFSSSCSVYGNADQLPVTEDTPRKDAESPYARTKQICEDILLDFARAYPEHRHVILRYFNPAGAHSSGLMGESPHNAASNLVPVITETAIGKRAEMAVFGTDYDTRDGSCVRDYIHIMDLADAHIRALQFLMDRIGII